MPHVTIMNLTKNINIINFDISMCLRISVKILVLSLFIILNISCEDGYNSYVEHCERHSVYYRLPEKYKLINGNSPGIYYNMQYVRDNMHFFYSDTLRINYFLFEGSAIDSSEFDFSDIKRAYLDQTPYLEGKYDTIVENMSDGNTKYIFVALRPSRCWNSQSDLENEIVAELNLICMVKTLDKYCYYFKINSFERLSEFNYNEKMGIINSIYVK